MSIWVCGKHEVDEYANRHRPSHLLTILDVGDSLQTPFGIRPTNHKSLNFWDTEKPTKSNSPSVVHCEEIINWAKELPQDSTLLVHCYAGMSRSTATAMAISVLQNGLESIGSVGDWIVGIRPIAMPNMLMAEHYDHLLSADGEFFQACLAVNTRANGYLLKQLADD